MPRWLLGSTTHTCTHARTPSPGLTSQIFHGLMVLDHLEHWTQLGLQPFSPRTQPQWALELTGPTLGHFTTHRLCLADVQTQGTILLGFFTLKRQNINEDS